MSESPLVSIVVPTRNRKARLAEALESIRSQTHPAWEVVIVDDASEDGTWDWLQGLGDERMRAIRLPGNSGSTITRNAGLRLANGEYCLFFDDDDILPDDALATHLGAIHGREDVIATLGTVSAFDGEHTIASIGATRKPETRDRIWREVQFWWSFMLGASLFRTSVIRQVGGFDESIRFYGDDIDLWMRIGHLGSVALLPEVVIRWRYHGQARPPDYLDMLTELGRRHAAGWEPERRAEAERILRARLALIALRFGSGKPGNWSRLARLMWHAVRCPYLLRSPVASGEIWRAVRRDVHLDPWLRPVIRMLGRGRGRETISR